MPSAAVTSSRLHEAFSGVCALLLTVLQPVRGSWAGVREQCAFRRGGGDRLRADQAAQAGGPQVSASSGHRTRHAFYQDCETTVLTRCPLELAAGSFSNSHHPGQRTPFHLNADKLGDFACGSRLRQATARPPLRRQHRAGPHPCTSSARTNHRDPCQYANKDGGRDRRDRSDRHRKSHPGQGKPLTGTGPAVSTQRGDRLVLGGGVSVRCWRLRERPR
jgi:hypothetical protein